MEEKTISKQNNEIPRVEDLNLNGTEEISVAKYVIEAYSESKLNSSKLDVLSSQIKNIIKEIKHLKSLVYTLSDKCSELDDKFDAEMECIQDALFRSDFTNDKLPN